MMDFDPANIVYLPTTGVRREHPLDLVAASGANLKGYGCLVEKAPEVFPIEIARWPAQGWRPVGPNSGDQGGVAAGTFELQWRGETPYARNNAVGDRYLFAWSTWPEEAAGHGPTTRRERALVWRANYHPDGGQLFYPLNGESFVVPLALPGDGVTPDRFVAFWCDGTCGVYIHPNVWHGAVVPFPDAARLLDRQGRVHARVSVDFAKEFGCYLAVPLQPPQSGA